MAWHKVQLPNGTTGRQLLNAAMIASTEGHYKSIGQPHAIFAGQCSGDCSKNILVSGVSRLCAKSGIDPNKTYSEIWLLNYTWPGSAPGDPDSGRMRKARAEFADRLLAALA